MNEKIVEARRVSSEGSIRRQPIEVILKRKTSDREKPTSSLAFTQKINPSIGGKEVKEPKVFEIVNKVPPKPTPKTEIAKPTIKRVVEARKWEPKTQHTTKVLDTQQLKDAISKIANRIKEHMINKNVFDEIQAYLMNNVQPDSFYIETQNCIYHSLLDFCGAIRTDEGVEFREPPPDAIYRPTLYFLERLYNHLSLSYEKDSEKIMRKYKAKFRDYIGIQALWLEPFKSRLEAKRKLRLYPEGVKIIYDFIDEHWCAHVDDVTPAPPIINSPEKKTPSPTPITDVQEIKKNDVLDGVTTKGSVVVDNDGPFQEGVTIEVWSIREHEDRIMVHCSSDDWCEEEDRFIQTPVSNLFYADLDSIEDWYACKPIDDRNGDFDMLVHYQPDFLIKVPIDRIPEYAGRMEFVGEAMLICVNMGLNSNTDGLIGAYLFSLIIDNQEVGLIDKELVRKINYIISSSCETGKLSRRLVTISNMDHQHLVTEEYLKEYIKAMKDGYSVVDDEEEEEEMTVDEEIDRVNEETAISALLDEDEEVEEFIDEELDSPQEMDTSVVSVGNNEEFLFTPRMD